MAPQSDPAAGAPLNASAPSTFYGSAKRSYLNYPTLNDAGHDGH